MLPERQSPPAGNRGASSVVSDDDRNTLRQTIDHISAHERRVLVDAFLEGWPVYWERRARALEAARPVPGDFVGRATREDLSAQWQRLTEAAAACRARAQVSPIDIVEPMVGWLHGEVA